MLAMRALFAAMTFNTIGWYFWTEQIAPFNVALGAWCFWEWMALFSHGPERTDVLDWVLPPLNQLCMLVRVFAQEINRMI